MGDVIELQERHHLVKAVRHLARADDHELSAISKLALGTLDHALAITLVNTMLVTHELMLRQKLQIERELIGMRLCSLRAGYVGSIDSA